MSITPKQLAANQQNALASTGPRTITGKSNSSRNSLKHGIFARHTVVSRLESTEEFDALLEDLSTDLAPSGVLEEILAGEIAALHWRLRRVLRAEAGASGAAIHDALTQPAQE